MPVTPATPGALGVSVAVVLLVLPVMLVLVPPVVPGSPVVTGAAVAQTLDDLDEAERQAERLESELDAATATYEQTWAQIETARTELVGLRQQAADLALVADEAERLLAERARAVFMRGSTMTLHALLTAGGPQEAIERAAMVASLQRSDGVRLEEAVAARQGLAQVRALVRERESALERLQARLEVEAEHLQARLSAAQAEVGEIRTLVARQRRIDRGAQQGIYACIFDRGAFRFRDTWGAPRSGGRRHKGTDVFAAMNAPVYALTSGVVIRQTRSRLGGIGLYLRGDDGNVYYYAHLNEILAIGRVGNRVVAGELVARNGATGNADRWAPHVHFELHPGGGRPVNPYPWLAAACS